MGSIDELKIVVSDDVFIASDRNVYVSSATVTLSEFSTSFSITSGCFSRSVDLTSCSINLNHLGNYQVYQKVRSVFRMNKRNTFLYTFEKLFSII